MHNITFVNKANFVKLYNNFVLKWLIFALYVVVVPEQILLAREYLEDTLRICDVSAMGLYYASRDASKVYESVSILLFSSMESVTAISVCVSPWAMILHPQASTKCFQEKIQEGLDISPNIAAIHPLHCGSFSEIAHQSKF